jgi:hypothetical protein
MSVDFCRRLAGGKEKEARDDPLLRGMFVHTQEEEYRMLVEAMSSGASPKELPQGHPGRYYAGVWAQLSLLDGEDDTLVLFDSCKIILPKGARGDVLSSSTSVMQENRTPGQQRVTDSTGPPSRRLSVRCAPSVRPAQAS